MIALSRADARRFRAVARRCCPSGRPKGPAPPVRLTADGETLALACHLGEVVVALRTTAPRSGTGEVTVPLTALAACEGTAGTATFTGGRRGPVTVRWDGGQAEPPLAVDRPDVVPAWPAEADRLIALPPHFPRALHEAGRCAVRDPGQNRFALTRIQVKGQDGEVVGTDGKQALVWGGFTFPFAEDVLVPAVPLFGSRELAGEAAVSAGLAKDWLYLVIGPWQVWLSVDREGRFPDVRAAIPRAQGTRVVFDDRDVVALLHALPGLPGNTESRPVNLDLGTPVTIRAREAPSAPVADVPLPFSSATGPRVQVVLGRNHLERALVLGLRDLRVSSPERPVVFRDADRTYLTATLDPSGAVPPPTTVADTTAPPMVPAPAPSSLPPFPERSHPMAHRTDLPTDRNGHADAPPTGDPIDPLAEAEGLRAALAEAVARATRLVAALRQFRKERRALSAAWSSLKQLNLGP
jgi:hypothetical protein